MKVVLAKPSSEEIDDYKEFKRIRWEVRHARNALSRARPLTRAIPSDTCSTRHVHSPYEEQPLSPKNTGRKRSLLYTETTIPTPSLPELYLKPSPAPSVKYTEGVDDQAARIVEDVIRHDSVAKGKQY